MSRLVFDAGFTATLPNYSTKTGKAARLVSSDYMDTLAGAKTNRVKQRILLRNGVVS